MTDIPREILPSDWNRDMLIEAFNRQRALQREAYGIDPRDLYDRQKIEFIKDMVLALTDELHEALQEVGWKPWATDRTIDVPAFKGEMVDAFHFFMNLCIVVGLGPHELFTLYIAKNEKNRRRQEQGYDGKAGKCPGCRRAYDDVAVNCQPADDSYKPFCAKVNQFIDPSNKIPLAPHQILCTKEGCMNPAAGEAVIGMAGDNEVVELLCYDHLVQRS